MRSSLALSDELCVLSLGWGGAARHLTAVSRDSDLASLAASHTAVSPAQSQDHLDSASCLTPQSRLEQAARSGLFSDFRGLGRARVS